MTKLETRPFDPAEYVDTPEAAHAYLNDAFASGDAAEIADAIGVVARARGMTDLARETGLSRQALYVALSAKGDPTLSSLLGVLKAMGVTLAVDHMGDAITRRAKSRKARDDFHGAISANGGAVFAGKVRSRPGRVLAGKILSAQVTTHDDKKTGKAKRRARAKLTSAEIL
jgi:probable addiction module antidote protein